MCKLLIRQCNHEIARETRVVATDCLQKRPGFHAIECRKVCIQQHPQSANRENSLSDSVWQCFNGYHEMPNAPDAYARLLPEGVQFVGRVGSETDIVHLFAVERRALADALRALLAKLRPDGAIWVSWPKKASKVQTDITEDTIREIALPMGLVDIKVCAVDETWSGLKLVRRRENRK